MKDTIKKSGIRDYLQTKHNLNVGSDVYDAADAAVKEVLDRAADRAQANQRRTVKARDL